jgi:hypothetical protein
VRRRRAGDRAESMDLLLDTICNMFGLFIFVAMLVALLARVGGPRIVEKPAERTDRVTEAVEEGRRSIRLLEAEVARFDPDRLARERSAVEESRRRVESARNELSSRNLLLRELERELDGAENLEGMLDRMVPRLEAEVASLDEELRSAESLKEVRLRTPRLREIAERIPVQMVISAGRVHCVNDWSDPGAHPCESWTTWNPQAVDTVASEAIVHYCWRTGGQDIERRIRLRENGGIPAEDLDLLESDGRWRRVLSWLDPDRHVVSLKVGTDSFAAFGPVRASLASLGFFYDVAPVALDPFYRDRIVEGATRAQ